MGSDLQKTWDPALQRREVAEAMAMRAGHLASCELPFSSTGGRDVWGERTFSATGEINIGAVFYTSIHRVLQLGPQGM